MHNHIII